MIKDNNIRIIITISKNEYEALQKLSNESGLSKSIIIRMALLEKLSLESLNSIRWTKPK